MTKSIHSFILLALFAPLACDDDTSLEALSVDADDPAASVGAAQPAGARSRAFEIHEDGESLADRIVAVVEADAETTIYFSRGDADVDGHFPVDVTILGRDGGFDYGGLVTSQQATPLELYLAVAADDAPVPEALQRAHDWQIAAEGRPAATPRPLAIPGADPLAAFEDILHTDQSDFTCLSWANFQSYMGSRFAGAPGRVQELGSATGSATIYNPHPSSWYPDSHVDMVACNYESSSSPGYNDVIHAELCHVRGFGGALTTNCGQADLDDGYYLRRIYGPISEYRQYKINVDPVSAASLQSYSGIVKRDA